MKKSRKNAIGSPRRNNVASPVAADPAPASPYVAIVSVAVSIAPDGRRTFVAADRDGMVWVREQNAGEVGSWSRLFALAHRVGNPWREAK